MCSQEGVDFVLCCGVEVRAVRKTMGRLEGIPEGGCLFTIANDKVVVHQDRGKRFGSVVEALNLLPELRLIDDKGVLF